MSENHKKPQAEGGGMRAYHTKRNIPWTWILGALVVLLILVLPSQEVVVSHPEEVVVEQARDVEDERTVLRNVTEQVMKEQVVNVSLNVSVQKEGDAYTTEEDGKEHIQQDYFLITQEPYEGCIAYNYSLYEDNRLVHMQDDEMCMKGKVAAFSVKDLYAGDADDYHFNVSLERPAKEQNVTLLVNVTVEKNVSLQTSKVVYENVTKTVMVNKTVSKNWLLALFS